MISWNWRHDLESIKHGWCQYVSMHLSPDLSGSEILQSIELAALQPSACMWRYYCLQLRVCHCALCILCTCHCKAQLWIQICSDIHWGQLFIPSSNRCQRQSFYQEMKSVSSNQCHQIPSSTSVSGVPNLQTNRHFVLTAGLTSAAAHPWGGQDRPAGIGWTFGIKWTAETSYAILYPICVCISMCIQIYNDIYTYYIHLHN